MTGPHQDKPLVKVPVRALVETMLRSGDLGLAQAGPNRNLEAVRAHQKIQKSRPPEYLKEVQVSRRLETALLILEIGGRIDGVLPEPEGVVIEEIKTTVRDLDAVLAENNSLHWGQVMVYACLYAQQEGLTEIKTRLVYYHLDQETIRTETRVFSLAELEGFFDDLTARYLAWAEKLIEWRIERDASLVEAGFPLESFRPGQRDMAVAVYRNIKSAGRLLVRAPTGIGKTLAALFPAAKALGEGLGRKIFYLTARTTGRVSAEKALDELRRGGMKIKALSLTAKDKICFQPEAGCDPALCEYARGHFDRVGPAVAEAFERDRWTRVEVEEAARQAKVCPFEFALDLALAVDVIVCDYNYAFDPWVHLRRFFDEGGPDYLFLVDEAHNLPDRARDMFSAEVSKGEVLEVKRLTKGRLPGAHRALTGLNAWMLAARKECEAGPGLRAEQVLPEEPLTWLKNLVKAVEPSLAGGEAAEFGESLLDFYFKAQRFIRTAEGFDQTYRLLYEPRGRDLNLKLFCLDPGPHLEKTYKRCGSAAFFSAALAPPDYFRETLGCGPEARVLDLPSPFPPDNLCLLVRDTVSTAYRSREKTRAEVARTIARAATARPGNYIAFFPSYQYLTLIRDELASDPLPGRVIEQTPGMTETEREDFLDHFVADSAEPLLGLAVMGGVFGEGVDLVGDRLAGVIVVGVGLPAISPQNDLIREYFMEKNGSGFEYAYMYPGFNRVLQAGGRVIRTENDRGLVLLIDERYSTRGYRRLFPEEWRPIRVRRLAEMESELVGFWGRF